MKTRKNYALRRKVALAIFVPICIIMSILFAIWIVTGIRLAIISWQVRQLEWLNVWTSFEKNKYINLLSIRREIYHSSPMLIAFFAKANHFVRFVLLAVSAGIGYFSAGIIRAIRETQKKMARKNNLAI